MPIQTDLDPTNQQQALERLSGISIGWFEGDENNTKCHLLEELSSRYPRWHPSCGFVGRARNNYIHHIKVDPTAIECGNCKRIYYALIRRAFWGK